MEVAAHADEFAARDFYLLADLDRSPDQLRDRLTQRNPDGIERHSLGESIVTLRITESEPAYSVFNS